MIRRRLLNLLTVLSLLLCVAVVALGVRSAAARELGLFQFGKGSQFVLQSYHGSLAFEIYPSNNPGGWSRRWQVMPDGPGYPGVRHWLATEFGFSATGNDRQEIPPHVRVPHWFAAAAALAVALCCAGRARCRPVQAHRGHCRRCGYDLRATPGRCPECGYTSKPTAL